jgi:hypothetical protein
MGATIASVGLVACGKKRAPAASLDAPCRGSACNTSGGAESEPPLDLDLDCGLTPEVQALHDQLLQPAELAEQPATCEAAVAAKSYIGCDFWPTVTANAVANIFDFTVVVANTGEESAEVVVGYRDDELARVTVAPASLEKIYLPWVDELKGSINRCGDDDSPLNTNSVLLRRGAYHLTSDFPVVVYQFSPLEFAPMGGPPGKSWTECTNSFEPNSYTNDASLLLPTQAMGTSYRGVMLTKTNPGQSFFTVTAPNDHTRLTVYPPPDTSVASGPGVPSTDDGEPRSFDLDAGDVLQMFPSSATLSGAVLESNQPVQLISGNECTNIPEDIWACDHLEETVPPAQALGRRYLLAAPTGPKSKPIRYALQLNGNQDDTHLYYLGNRPKGAPTSLQAGESVFLANVSGHFEVFGDHEFGVLLYLQGGSSDDALNGNTDPSQSIAIPTEQFRRRYVFLAPDDYLVSYADVTVPTGTIVKLDGRVAETKRETFDCAGFELLRIWLDSSQGGIHVLEGNLPIGVQVVGHASYTSYQYPGGLNVSEIAPAPTLPHPPVK